MATIFLPDMYAQGSCNLPPVWVGRLVRMQAQRGCSKYLPGVKSTLAL